MQKFRKTLAHDELSWKLRIIYYNVAVAMLKIYYRKVAVWLACVDKRHARSQSCFFDLKNLLRRIHVCC